MLRLGVTGASGFVGGAVCRAAVNEGWQVSAFGRRPSVEPAGVGGAPYTPWDLLGARPELPELDVVIHCAGSVTDWGPRRRSGRPTWTAPAPPPRPSPAPGSFMSVRPASTTRSGRP
ncbi:NAD-dependent epimerase/dehydratase family protein [Streptosporangium lutulentum]